MFVAELHETKKKAFSTPQSLQICYLMDAKLAGFEGLHWTRKGLRYVLKTPWLHPPCHCSLAMLCMTATPLESEHFCAPVSRSHAAREFWVASFNDEIPRTGPLRTGEMLTA
jgi:hypothetical protein